MSLVADESPIPAESKQRLLGEIFAVAGMVAPVTLATAWYCLRLGKFAPVGTLYIGAIFGYLSMWGWILMLLYLESTSEAGWNEFLMGKFDPWKCATFSLLGFAGALAARIAILRIDPTSNAGATGPPRHSTPLQFAGVPWTWSLLAPLTFAVFEETLARGWLPARVKQLGASETSAAIAGLAASAILHAYQGPVPVVCAVGAGFVFQIVARRSGTLLAAIAAHIALDAVVMWLPNVADRFSFGG